MTTITLSKAAMFDRSACLHTQAAEVACQTFPGMTDAAQAYLNISTLQMLHVLPEGSSHPQQYESINGITPAMRNARKRHFKPVDISIPDVASVEDDVLQIVQV